MSNVYEFINECSCFFVLTLNGNFPAGRPFGAIMEEGGDLYISTHDRNQAHRQLQMNGNVQILAKKDQSRQWLRVTGLAEECHDVGKKQKMMDQCPVLKNRFSSAESEHFLLFKITVIQAEFM